MDNSNTFHEIVVLDHGPLAYLILISWWDAGGEMPQELEYTTSLMSAVDADYVCRTSFSVPQGPCNISLPVLPAARQAHGLPGSEA